MQSTESAETKTENPIELAKIVKPAVSLQELKANYEEYEKIKKLLLKPEDYYTVNIKGKEVDALGKAGWYKLGVAFNLTTTILQEIRTLDPDTKVLRYDITVRCLAPNGRFAEEVGSCDDGPKDKSNANEHVVRATAKTRATERAYIVILGVSEKSAEDLSAAGTKKPTSKTNQLCTCTPEARNPGETLRPDNLLECRTCANPISQIATQAILSQRGKSPK